MTSTYWDWRPKGLCKKLTHKQADKLFFPDSGRSINKAKAFCQGCPVSTECLEYALDNKLGGIWAGTNETERKRILRFRDKLSGVVTPRKIVERRNITFT